jgi:excinuclease ABC subunit C
MMREVLTRRFKHREWQYPKFLLIDGGKPQLTIAGDVLRELDLHIPYGGLAKRQEELIIPVTEGYKTVRLPLSGKAIKVLQRVRDEAHRFAISYHRLLRAKKTVPV